MTLPEGTKYDEGKAPLDLLSPPVLIGTAKVLQFGAKKYEPYNWAEGLAYSRVYAALIGHLLSFWSGEKNDAETGMHHLLHANCCLMFLTHYELHPSLYSDYDDRYPYAQADSTPARR